MTNRFQELFRLPPKLYLEGSPVVIEAGVLQKDNATNKVLVQIKLKNIVVKNIISCKISLRTYEPNGEELEGISSFSYLDINVKTGEEFGSKTPVFLPDNTTRKFSVAVTEVVFEDNSVLNLDQSEWTQIPIQRAIVEVFDDPETIKQYEIAAGPNSAFYPEVTHGLFLCTCGNVNSESIGKCYKCYRKYDNLVKILNEESLIAKKDERLRKEQEEREANRIAAEKAAVKRKKIIAIATPIAVVGIALILFLVNFPNSSKYKQALSMIESKDYVGAQALFEELGDYKDSEFLADTIELKGATAGKTITFGLYEQDNDRANGKEPIEWDVLAVEGNKALIISKYGLDNQPFYPRDTEVTWETSTLRSWMNDIFLNNAFGSKHQEIILSSIVSADKNPDYNTNPGNVTTDKVFLLSINEVNKYFSSDDARECIPTEYAKANGEYYNRNKKTCWWWLRSPGSFETTIAFVNNNGWVNSYGPYKNSAIGCVRPALWINLDF